MKEHERLAKLYSKTELESMQGSYSRKIDSAKGLELAAARRRYWSFEKAIELKRTVVSVSCKAGPGYVHFGGAEEGCVICHPTHGGNVAK